jgi:hypothetical protein
VARLRDHIGVKAIGIEPGTFPMPFWRMLGEVLLSDGASASDAVGGPAYRLTASSMSVRAAFWACVQGVGSSSEVDSAAAPS